MRLLPLLLCLILKLQHFSLALLCLAPSVFAQQQDPFFFFDVFFPFTGSAALVFLAGAGVAAAAGAGEAGAVVGAAGWKVKLPAGGYATIDGAVGKVIVCGA